MFKTTLITFSLLFSLSTLAATKQECRVFMSTELHEIEHIFTIDTSTPAGNHGGVENTLTKADYSVTYKADSKWLALSWWKGDDVIAEGVFVLSTTDTKQSRVAILYNPKNRDEQISLDCSEKL